jgi:hypothetical protein
MSGGLRVVDRRFSRPVVRLGHVRSTRDSIAPVKTLAGYRSPDAPLGDNAKVDSSEPGLGEAVRQCGSELLAPTDAKLGEHLP